MALIIPTFLLKGQPTYNNDVVFKFAATEVACMPTAKGVKILPQIEIVEGSTAIGLQESFNQIATLSAQIKEATGGVTIIGNVIYSDKPEGSTTAAHTGMVSFTTDGDITGLNNKSLGGCITGLEFNGVYHNFYVFTSAITKKQTFYHKTYNTETWAQLNSKTITEATTPRAICSDGMNVYGCFFNGLTGEDAEITFAQVDLSTDTQTPICRLPSIWNACAMGNDGFIYAIDVAGNLQKVVPTTGEMTKVGATGAVPAYISGAAIDKASGRMFWTVTPEDKTGNLYEVNLTTGHATKLCQFQYNDEIAGLYIPFKASAKAPGQATELNAIFPNGSLEGSFNFKCPTMTADSVAASGEVSYSVYCNNKLIATGKSSFGASVKTPVTVDEAGMYDFAVIISNDEGEGPKTELAPMYIGNDTPKAPIVKASYSSGVFKVEWEEAKEGVHGGYVDTSKLSYNVMREPDSIQVATDIKALTFLDSVAEPQSMKVYTYDVIATCNGLRSDAGKSNVVVLGSIIPPYENDFSATDALAGFTIIDANNDATRFFLGGGTVKINSLGGQSPMDDWLITPPITFEAGKLYRFSTDASNGANNNKEQLEVRMGDSPTVEAMSTLLVDTVTLDGNKTVKTIEHYISVPKTGIYYIGIHGVSQAKGFFMYLYNIHIDAPSTMALPMPVDSIAMEVDSLCALKATISATAPSKNMEGTALEYFSGIKVERNGEYFLTLNDIKVGERFSFVDSTMTTPGVYTYSLTAFNTAGTSTAVTVNGFVGMNKPDRVTNLETAQNQQGNIDIKWDAPLTDIDGKLLPPNVLQYYILDATDPQTPSIVVQGLQEPAYTYKYSGAQKFFIPGVFAMDASGASLGVKGRIMAVGAPYVLPWKETFAGATASTLFATQALDNTDAATWAVMKDANSDVKSYDNDGGYLICQTKTVNQTSLMFTGKIDLGSASEPVFKFYTYNLISKLSGEEKRDINEIDIMIREANSNSWTSLLHGTVDALCNGDTAKWCRVTVDLTDYKGKQVQIGLKVKCKYYQYTMFDALSVYDKSLGSIDSTNKERINIEASKGVLKITGNDRNKVSISNVDGKLILSSRGDIELQLAPGIYIVRAGNVVKKVIL